MSCKYIIYACFTLTFLNFVNSQACPFNNISCACNGQPIQVSCTWDTPDFPDFEIFNLIPISEITVFVSYVGNSTLTIPSNAFENLQSLQNGSNVIFVGSYETCELAPNLVLSEYFLNTTENLTFQDVAFANLRIHNLSAKLFDKIVINNLLAFYQCCLYYVQDYAFSGLNVYTLVFYETVIKYDMEPFALTDISFPESFNSEIQFTSAGLNNSLPFKYANSYQLWIDFNNISNLEDFAFCRCNSLFLCNNTALTKLYLENNNIEYVSNNAFANLPNLTYIFLTNNNIQTIYLTNTFVTTLDIAYNMLIDFSTSNVYVNSLYLSDNQLTVFPTQSIQSLATSLTFVDLSDNNITSVVSNAFYGCTKITNINLNYNPISTIEPGAFNGLISLNSLTLSYLNQLKTVDLLIAYGITNLKTLYLTSNAMEIVFISDSSKLPLGLSNIYIGQIDTLIQVDSSLESWLKISSKNVYTFAYNNQFPCNDGIQWMGKYAVCSPMQISTYGSTCQDGTTLQSYLEAVTPTC